jgi:hypothetical protein
MATANIPLTERELNWLKWIVRARLATAAAPMARKLRDLLTKLDHAVFTDGGSDV